MLQELLFRTEACKMGGVCGEMIACVVSSSSGELCDFPLTPNPSPARGEGNRRGFQNGIQK
jgi:hypothetical protein